jgi:homoserine dehydrogenase
MAIAFHCKCGKRTRVGDGYAGKRGYRIKTVGRVRTAWRRIRSKIRPKRANPEQPLAMIDFFVPDAKRRA